jgi:hypothetical protein
MLNLEYKKAVLPNLKQMQGILHIIHNADIPTALVSAPTYLLLLLLLLLLLPPSPSSSSSRKFMWFLGEEYGTH